MDRVEFLPLWRREFRRRRSARNSGLVIGPYRTGLSSAIQVHVLPGTCTLRRRTGEDPTPAGEPNTARVRKISFVFGQIAINCYYVAAFLARRLLEVSSPPKKEECPVRNECGELL